MKKIFCFVLIIVICLLLVSCNIWKNKIDSDNNKLEVKLDQGKTLIFYFKNDRVSTYEEYFEYEDEEEADLSLKITQSELKDDDVIDIFRDGKYVVLKYSSTYIAREFKDLSKNEIAKIYSIYEENN